MSVNTNISAMNAYRNLSSTNNSMSKSLERLSSGFRINRAADDAAGLAISEGLRSQIGGITQAVRNTQDGVSVVQTAEGGLNETTSILQRMRDLAVQSANDSNDTNSRAAIDAEGKALQSELTRIADKTTFNNINLLNGDFTGKSFQVGYASGDTINVDITSKGVSPADITFANGGATLADGKATFTVGSNPAVTTGDLTASTDANDIADQLNADGNFAAAFTASVDKNTGGLVVTSKDATKAGTLAVGGTLTVTTDAEDPITRDGTAATGGFSATDLGVNLVDLTSKAGATSAITKIDNAIKAVSTARANLGALQNRFEHTINNLNTTNENLTASESRIRDTDMAQEMTNFTRTQVLTQAGTSMLAQANQSTQSILKLLG
ncbi:flagellin N-terminal helical domain-containing protein [Modestobacter excelsi]|uniref:flagellin N-terminal helical domain-containing protein n=1 Tax=Modestobacter excelsi TaxID=2213161 RepID=UPI0024822FD9|nr:flagellin [Modestobacter excelsi]